MQELAGKTAVITGAASGIGLALARIFAEQGMNIVLADIEQQRLDAAVTEISALGVEAIGVVTDVGSGESVASLRDAAVEQFGSVQILCNNAGVYTGGNLWEQTEDDYEWLIRVNQWGIIHGVRQFVPQMISQGDACYIVNTSSMASMCTLPFAGIYHMTKHAALALSECLYHELSISAPQIKVSCLCPELFNTGIAASSRNRPEALREENITDMHKMSMDAITDATANSLSPRVAAERVLQAIKDETFYILPPEDNPWSATANSRLEDLRLRRNPTMAPPAI
ncbi:NAD(P)-dependent dehydrogenase (short-subunit alcohol dehydrogenase family) [Litorivivens lipolytica]|uniref:NAD(P)-dependent dehydrogenase (Short-subunit alcohol dehydrogenase family) n=1 Tax=Litorivivens lipolytica TaxID=1524264 RepID=A0A7W4W5R8_9GAMM|nr:NAD(P)-dependent dehydrogenase (short-subunit alcohol dehydrogenase family) [Litorivivens lipolytica]